MKHIRTYRRAMLALLFPAAWLRWVNMDRCYVMLQNDPSGTWSLQVGVSMPVLRHRSIRWLCWNMFWACEQNPKWKWCADYLNE